MKFDLKIKTAAAGGFFEKVSAKINFAKITCKNYFSHRSHLSKVVLNVKTAAAFFAKVSCNILF